tara:strand:+ start:198 stop:542 length:345 start_codon:yes stop_codon:yes gene_type:complete
MIFTHVSLIQEGEAALFYRFDRKLSGYMIAGVIISDTMEARLEFVKVWKYFVSEIVQKDDIYASIPLSVTNSMFTNYTSYYDTIEGRKLYKVDNYLKKQYSNYEKHLERAGSNE